MSHSHLVRFVSASVTLVAASASAANPADLITVSVKGTSIRVLPVYIDVIADDPHGQADILARAGGVETEVLGRHTASVTLKFNHVLYFFTRRGDRNAEIKGHRFRDGDVVYGLQLDSPEETAEFVSRHNLTLASRIKSSNGSFALYRSSPGYYVICCVPVLRFSCPMHPRIALRTKGKCPICAMDLIGIESYEPIDSPQVKRKTP